ncbi:cytosolic phospholipase A2 gamma-like [Labeo rohita]|uniref:cytosolic phospholipase A2 gamma-like n=1 Tax=Labeo rohita TaxID=84645 RepID=UPI0021E2BFB3|nr:cytosolic phospholipase A2 gamma-like [Labeo rohita]
MSASKLQESGEVRIANSLHTNEKEFVARRRESVFQSLQKLKIHCSQDDVPNIALLGSGGGQRAMVGLLGSLIELDKVGLLDCILYLSGVSGSTWCMASLYKEPDWSTKLDTVKDKIIKRLSGPKVSQGDAFEKLKKYHMKDNFTLTDVWAAMVITENVKEIDELPLTDHWDPLSKDPFPIYTAIDNQCKQEEGGDPWFEISPQEAGYSLTGAFVETSSFGSQFDKGSKKKPQPEMDMLYLQALCGSALAEKDTIRKFLWEKIKDFLQHVTSTVERDMSEEMKTDPKNTLVYKCYQVLMGLVDMNLSVLNGKDSFDLDQSIIDTLKELGGEKSHLTFLGQKNNFDEKQAAILHVKEFTEQICKDLNWFHSETLDLSKRILTCMHHWIWGRNYNFLHKITDQSVPSALLKSETRDYEDAGLLLNSPYFSVLREERQVDLIISLDFSEGDPFMSVTDTHKLCEELNIPFPEVNIPSEDLKKPKDFYVFKGKNAPTVIHIPLLNVVNCGDKLETYRDKYRTFQLPYTHDNITELMELAGQNILNNKEKLKKQIGDAVQKKTKE